MPKYTKDGKIKGPGEIMEDASKASAKYKKAKDTDPNLKLYIKKRKELKAKGLTTKDPEYAKIQNLINKAYGVKKRYPVNEVSRKEDGYPAAERLRAEKEKRKNATPAKAKIIEPPKEIKFDSPTPKVAGAKKPAAAKKTTTDAGSRDRAKVIGDEIKRDTPASKKQELTKKEKRQAKRANRKNKPVETTAAMKKADNALEKAANRPMRGGGRKKYQASALTRTGAGQGAMQGSIPPMAASQSMGRSATKPITETMSKKELRGQSRDFQKEAVKSRLRGNKETAAELSRVGKNLRGAAKSKYRAGGAKPDYLDMDGDGNKNEPMKSAIRSKKGMGGKKLYKSGGIKKAKKMYGGMKDRRK